MVVLFSRLPTKKLNEKNFVGDVHQQLRNWRLLVQKTSCRWTQSCIWRNSGEFFRNSEHLRSVYTRLKETSFVDTLGKAADETMPQKSNAKQEWLNDEFFPAY